MKSEKGNEKKRFGGFLKDRNIPSLTINFDKPSNPCLWWDGIERECCAEIMIDEKGQDNMEMIVCDGMRWMETHVNEDELGLRECDIKN